MRSLLIALAAGIAIGALGVWGYSRQQQAAAAPDEPRTAGTPSEIRTVKLPAEQQLRAGIRVANLASRELPQEIEAYSQVLDPQPLLDVVTEVRSAEAALEASAKEYERVRVLHANDQNASARAVEAARVAMMHDRIQLDAARGKLANAGSPALIQRTDLTRIAQALPSLEAVLIRADVPLGEALPAAPVSARVQSPMNAAQSAQAEFLGPAGSANPQAPGQGFLFLLQPNSLDLRPGMGLVVFLSMPGGALRGVVLPRAAIVRHEGRPWMYARIENETFQRRPVALTRTTEEGWFLTDADRSDPVVVAGAQVLLSQELKSQIHLED